MLPTPRLHGLPGSRARPCMQTTCSKGARLPSDPQAFSRPPQANRQAFNRHTWGTTAGGRTFMACMTAGTSPARPPATYAASTLVCGKSGRTAEARGGVTASVMGEGGSRWEARRFERTQFGAWQGLHRPPRARAPAVVRRRMQRQRRRWRRRQQQRRQRRQRRHPSLTCTSWPAAASPPCARNSCE